MAFYSKETLNAEFSVAKSKDTILPQEHRGETAVSLLGRAHSALSREARNSSCREIDPEMPLRRNDSK